MTTRETFYPDGKGNLIDQTTTTAPGFYSETDVNIGPQTNILGINGLPATPLNITTCVLLFFTVIGVIILIILFVSIKDPTETFTKNKIKKNIKQLQEKDKHNNQVHFYIIMRNKSKWNLWYKDNRNEEMSWFPNKLALFQVSKEKPSVDVFTECVKNHNKDHILTNSKKKNVSIDNCKKMTPLLSLKIEPKHGKNNYWKRKDWNIKIEETKLKIKCQISNTNKITSIFCSNE
ncbi:MAG: hypothetical protein CBD97_02080 [Pelagibacteraceae bacterium TMED237]|nr:MAG: hypothetical protein CBD97_02080 [Pelagibacteraceae bacterium TMED237]|tara:strand:- start:7875 stop:8573 length:699 start_codon:yes stop_codon:yes gene_type:complete